MENWTEFNVSGQRVDGPIRAHHHQTANFNLVDGSLLQLGMIFPNRGMIEVTKMFVCFRAADFNDDYTDWKEGW